MKEGVARGQVPGIRGCAERRDVPSPKFQDTSMLSSRPGSPAVPVNSSTWLMRPDAGPLAPVAGGALNTGSARARAAWAENSSTTSTDTLKGASRAGWRDRHG